jgi:hypothetical protein
MRSDAAPAIDLTANYTYTGAWTFSRASTTSALNIYANATVWQMVMGYAGTAEFKMDCLNPISLYISGTKYLAVTAGNVDVPTGTLTVASTSVRDGGILTSGTVNAARLPTFGAAAAGIVPLSGGGTSNYLRADGTWATPPSGGTAANPSASLGLTAINGVATTYMRSDAAPALDVTIAPTWTATHNFTAATGMGVASPTAVLHLKAGTATASTAPLKFSSGTNLTTAEAGSCEYDGNNFYKTVDTTHGRNVTSVLQQFILTANGSALSGATQNVFGATSAASLAASSTYEINCYCHFLKTTAGTVQWIPTWSSAFTMAHSYLEYTPVTGFTTTLITGAMVTAEATVLTSTNTALPATASLSSGVNHIAKIRIFVTTNAACNFRLNNTIGTGSITMQAGSYYTVRKVVSTAGNFVA